jgi:hypothetical protein
MPLLQITTASGFRGEHFREPTQVPHIAGLIEAGKHLSFSG